MSEAMEEKNVKEVALSLGSNVGDSYQTLLSSLKDLSRFVDDMKVSSFYRTDPMDMKYQPDFINLVVAGKTSISPDTLLKKVNSVEKKYGRARSIKYGPRTLDIDIILFGSEIVKRDDLVIPHPAFRRRLFVIEPLAEIAPEMKDPVDGKEVHEILKEARARFSNRIEKL
ncbi:MAG: 2-amino-4-hydroxy-6-hydroxymethyldihydropteridine diphosphokinase [Elusimicrobia bacterium HGW-Elusimicrobia-2]|nr:MAG: 2-amino-4-hydroxy-6-hydroxymethyldihydropteridine diphosphokinase [Elusimicrobia bacterium HGW-Elusimicrobia-2]